MLGVQNRVGRLYFKLLRLLLFTLTLLTFGIMATAQQVTYDELKKLMNDKSVYIIDVREPDELIQMGQLPNSINIPLNDVPNVLKNMNEKEFLQKYGRPKPAEDTPIVFSCMSGKRSKKAQQAALEINFTNVREYGGGWSEWAQMAKSS